MKKVTYWQEAVCDESRTQTELMQYIRLSSNAQPVSVGPMEMIKTIGEFVCAHLRCAVH